MKSFIKHTFLLLITIYTYSNYAFSEPIKKNVVFLDLSDSILNHKNDDELLSATVKLRDLLINPETIFESGDLFGGITTIIYSQKAATIDLSDYKLSIITAIDIYLKELDARIDKNWNYDDEIEKALNYHNDLKFNGDGLSDIKDPVERKVALHRLDLEKKKMKKVNFINNQQRVFMMVRENLLSSIASKTAHEYDNNGWRKNDVIARFGINKECKLILLNHLERKGK